MNKDSEEFVSQIRKAIEATFKKAPGYETAKIEFYLGKKPKDYKEVKVEKNIKAYINMNEYTDKGTQFWVHLYIPGEQNCFTCTFIDENMSEELRGTLVSSQILPDVHKSLVLTTITKE